MAKDKRIKEKSNLTGAQAITYQREFKKADRAAGFVENRK